jgi:serine/threonine-protein kinase
VTASYDRLVSALADRYALEREIGAGGMATVYVAEDLRHGRKVAIKVLRPELAAVIGAERFVREIRTVAALQHPHILGLIDSGEVEGTAYYVMPFIDGESLRDRLTREKQLAISESVRIASEVASALDYAHRHGVIHRDIKPENILLHDGRALVADFGIALAASKSGSTRMTETGMSLGTPHYMSPEQAMGEREITSRSDLFALGCVTYEMLIGEPPFTGPSAQAIVARMMTEEPRSLMIQRKTIPPYLDDAVRTALARLPADRFASANEFAEALKGKTADRDVSLLSRPAPAVRPSNRLAAVLAGALLLTGAIALWGWFRPHPGSVQSASLYLDVVLPDSAPLEFIGEAPVGVGQTAIALAPDGTTLAFVAGRTGRSLLYVRALDHDESIPLPGTDGAFAPFFSPDGAWIGFFADNQLKKVPTRGGPVATLADAPLSRGGVWYPRGEIVYLISQGARLLQISTDGGQPVSLQVAPGYVKNMSHLPGKEDYLLCTGWSEIGFNFLLIHELKNGEDRVLVRKGPAQIWRPGQSLPDGVLLGESPHYVAGQGLYYVRPDGALMKLRFDLARMETTGEPEVIAAGVRRESYSGHAQVAVADNGTVAYATGGDGDVGALAWLDRSGKLDTLPFPPAHSYGMDVSANGADIAIAIPAVSGDLELWLYDLRREERRRLVSGLRTPETRWTHDGRSIVASLAVGQLVRIDPARSGWLDTLTRFSLVPSSLSSDGRLLLGSRPESDSASRAVVLTLDGSSPPRTLAYGGPNGSYLPSFSPDGRWVTYLGWSGGVFVEPFPLTGEVYRISEQLEGDVPYWSRDGKEIVFPSSSQLYTVTVRPGSPPRFDKPRLVSVQRLANYAGRPYAVAPDGDRFLIKLPSSEHSAPSIRIILNGMPAGPRQ